MNKRPRRRVVVVASICIGVLVLAAAGAAVVVTTAQAETAQGQAASNTGITTTEVRKGTLSGVKQVSATMDYSDVRELGGGGSGIVTAAPEPGAVIGRGQGLFSVNNVPVILLHGVLPAWRPFETGMEDGPDVRQLEENLAALGFFDREPDEEFAWSTMNAIERWQEALALEETGRIDLGQVVFQPGDVRISSVESAVGSQAGPVVMKVSSLTKRVEADLRLDDQALGVVGNKVEIQLPGGTTTAGTITDVSVPVEKEANGEKSVVVPVGIAIDDPAAVGTLQRAAVTVGFPAEQRENVLYVPVEALIALDSETFGVEVRGPNGDLTKIRVETGLFADGKVEISGTGITAGLDVVVPS